MPETRPDPLVPAEADLRGYDFMPFYGAWLRASDFNATCTDAEYRAAVNLWWSSWHQMPPASLPDDDRALCMHADMGRELKRWLKVKKVAMSGFVLCSDGRWYHEFLSVQARMAWDQRKAAIDRGMKSGASRRLKASQSPLRKQVESVSKQAGDGMHTVGNKGEGSEVNTPPTPPAEPGVDKSKSTPAAKARTPRIGKRWRYDSNEAAKAMRILGIDAKPGELMPQCIRRIEQELSRLQREAAA